MATIKVPKTPKRAFNKDRRPSKLLIDQIRHLEWAALPARQRAAGDLPKETVRTEGEAAIRVAQLTRIVLKARESSAQPAPEIELPAVVLPPLPSARRGRKAPTRRPRKRAARRR